MSITTNHIFILKKIQILDLRSVFSKINIRSQLLCTQKIMQRSLHM